MLCHVENDINIGLRKETKSFLLCSSTQSKKRQVEAYINICRSHESYTKYSKKDSDVCLALKAKLDTHRILQRGYSDVGKLTKGSVSIHLCLFSLAFASEILKSLSLISC